MMPDRATNELHASNPEVGDYWHETLSGIMVVLNVKDDRVVVCDGKVYEDDGWYWDYSKIKTYTREEFARKVRIDDSIDEFWCDVMPRRMPNCRDEAKAHATAIFD